MFKFGYQNFDDNMMFVINTKFIFTKSRFTPISIFFFIPISDYAFQKPII